MSTTTSATPIGEFTGPYAYPSYPSSSSDNYNDEHDNSDCNDTMSSGMRNHTHDHPCNVTAWVDEDSEAEREEADIRRRDRIWTGQKEKEVARSLDRVENFFDEEAEEDGGVQQPLKRSITTTDSYYTEEERLDGFVIKDDDEVTYDTDYEEEKRKEAEQDDKDRLEQLEKQEKAIKRRLRKVKRDILQLKRSRRLEN